MILLRLAALAAALLLPVVPAPSALAQTPAPAAAEAPLPAFPGALGWVAQTPGGRGGQIIRVTNLDASGPGSLRAAIEADGPRSTIGAYNVIIDHCITWATDENLSASGPRFTGATPAEWRRGTSHNITFSNNLNGESLAYSTHSKGEHSKGSLIHDNVTGLLIVGNLYAHNYERSPLFKGGVHGVIVNNLIYNPGPRAIHYNLAPEEWGTVPFEVGKMTVIGNVLRAGPSTPTEHLAFMMIGGAGDVEYYGRDNIAVDQVGEPLRMFGRYTTSNARIIQTRRPPVWWEGLTPMPAVDVQRAVLSQVGARPWDRDMRDVLLIAEVAEGRGEIIDHEREVGGYPAVVEATRKPFNPEDWDLRFMTPLRDEVLDRPATRRGT